MHDEDEDVDDDDDDDDDDEGREDVPRPADDEDCKGMPPPFRPCTSILCFFK